jgi:hypothetical protein
VDDNLSDIRINLSDIRISPDWARVDVPSEEEYRRYNEICDETERVLAPKEPKEY